MSGLILNATICAAIMLSAFAFALTLYRNKPKCKDQSTPSMMALIDFWVLIALSFLFVCVRVIAAFYGYAEVDRVCYYIASIPFAFLPVPIVFFIVYVTTGGKAASWAMSLLFSIFGIAYLTFLYTSGVVGPEVTYWATIFSIDSEIAITVYLAGLFIVPTAMIFVLLGITLIRKISRRRRYHIALVLVAISMVFDFILVDMVAVQDTMQVAARLFILIGVVLAFLAYYPPDILQDRLSIRKVRDAEPDAEEIDE